MDYAIFAQSIARIKALETRMLSKTRLDSLIESKDFEECIRILQDSQYASYVSQKSYEYGLKQAIEEFYEYMYKIIPVKEIVDIMTVRYDAHNIKSMIKGKFISMDISSLLVKAGTIPVDVLHYAITEENYKVIPEVIKNSIQKAVNSYRTEQDPQNIDIIIDKGIYEYALEIARISRMDYLIEFTKLMIDIINIKTFIRLKAQDRNIDFLEKVFIHGGTLSFDIFAAFINDSLDRFANKILYTDYAKWSNEGIGEYIRNGDIGSIEKFGDNYILNYLRKAKFISLGPEPPVAYIFAKENEIKILRIILTGKRNNVHPDIIRERMRDVYV